MKRIGHIQLWIVLVGLLVLSLGSADNAALVGAAPPNFAALNVATSVNQLFSAPIYTQTVLAPTGVEVGDFNHDGIPDLVTTHAFNAAISVLLGTGNGTFTLRATYSVGIQPTITHAADFNRDGNLDLAVLDYNRDTVSIFLGVGDGTFRLKADYAIGLAPKGMVIGDLNNDGKIDLVVTGLVIIGTSFTSSVGVFLGQGDGSFAAGTEFGTEVFPSGVSGMI